MENEKKKLEIREVCQNCYTYNRQSRKCRVTGKYVARKHTCSEIKVKV